MSEEKLGLQEALDAIRELIDSMEPTNKLAKKMALDILDRVEEEIVWKEYWADYAQVIITGSVPPPKNWEG